METSNTKCKLFCEYSENPLGIDNNTPCFTWALLNTEENGGQATYQVLVFSSEAVGTDPDMWDSGTVQTDESSFVVYAGKELQSRTRYFWKVHIRDKTGRMILSETAYFETAFLDAKEWQAKWIGPSRLPLVNPIFRRVVEVRKGLASARVYVTGLSAYELTINGTKVNRNILEPSWTDYYRRIHYNTLDVGSFLKTGKNAINILTGFVRHQQIMLLLQMYLTYIDGTEEIIYTDRDEHWGVYFNGPVTSRKHWPMMAVYFGESIDGRVKAGRLDDPSVPNEDIDGMHKPLYVQSPGGKLVAQRIEPIRVIREYPAVQISEPKPGLFVVDFGQNIAGWVRIRVRGEAGRQITIRHGESLYEDGRLNQENLRLAQNREEYILGGGEEIFEPHFTYHGFRYAEIEGYPGVLGAKDITAFLARNDVPVRSGFTSGNDILNRIHRVMMLTEECNMHGVPTDCPQRDERLGWTNEGTIRAETSITNFDGIHFFRKWEQDIADTQTAIGTISDTAPDVRGMFGKNPADAVASCYQLIPWLLYLHYGDTATMAHHYDGLKAWTDYKKLASEDGIVDYFYYADWTSPGIYSVANKDAPGNGAQSAITPGELISTGFWLWENRLMADIACVLHRESDADAFERQALFIEQAFNKTWFSPELGYYRPGSQAAQVFPLWLDIVPKKYKETVARHLVEDIQQKNYTHSVGNQCWKMLPEVLCDNGYVDVAFRMLTNTAYPSIGFMLENGATTLWERWENLTGNGMNSHNQPSFGSVDVWFYKYLAGIKVLGPGFSRIQIRPFIPRYLPSVEAHIDTIRGRVASAWKKVGANLTLTVTVPWNSLAIIELPSEMDGKKATAIDHNGMGPVRNLVFERGSGTWPFTVHYE
jgi:alpha-L-rhamnosidase